MHQYPSHVELYFHYFRGFGFAPHEATRDLLKKGISEILEDTGRVEYVLPTLILLASDEDKDIRKSAFDDFQVLLAKNPKKVSYFGNILDKLTHDKNFHTRGDVAPEIAVFLERYPDAGDVSADLFEDFLDLSRDPKKYVRHQVAQNIVDVIQLAKKGQINLIFQVLFRFIREDDKDLKHHAIEGFRAATYKFPDRIPDILLDIKRVNKREQLSDLNELIAEFSKSNRNTGTPDTMTINNEIKNPELLVINL